MSGTTTTLTANVETTLGTLTGLSGGSLITVSLDRTVSASVLVKGLNFLDSRTTVIVRFYVSTDGGQTEKVACSGTITAGASPVTSSSIAMSAAAGEQVRVTAQMVTAAVLSSASAGVTLTVSP